MNPKLDLRLEAEMQIKLACYHMLRGQYFEEYCDWYCDVWAPAKRRGETIDSPYLDEWVLRYK